jgi:hypothetical protein
LTVIYTDEPSVGPQSPISVPEPGLPYYLPTGPLSGWGEGKEKTDIIVRETILSGFEQVITVAEETVNLIFKTLWESARKSTQVDVLYKWSFEKKFSATFEHPRIQLLSGGKALIWVTLRSGSMNLDGQSETAVNGWCLAFEVKLKQVKHSELQVEKSWFGRFKDALFGKAQEESKSIDHVVLDFDSMLLLPRQGDTS